MTVKVFNMEGRTGAVANQTGKYRNQFLGETKAETEKKIKAGFYKLADLN